MKTTTNRSLKIAALVAVGACAAFAATALAQDHGKHGRHGKHPKAATAEHPDIEEGLKKLGATDAQLKQLRDLHLATLETGIDRRAAAQKAALKLHGLMIKGDASDADLLTAFDANAKAHAALGRLHLEGLLKARKVLGPALSKKIHKAHRKGGMGHPGMGHPGMGHPGMGHPGMGRPGMGHPGMGRPGMGRPGMGHHGKGHPGMGGARKHLRAFLGGHCKCDSGH